MSKSKDKVVGELEFLRHIVSETARMSYPGRFGVKLCRSKLPTMVIAG
jgi:hypothetical protein